MSNFFLSKLNGISQLFEAITISNGAYDAGKIAATDATGKFDPSLLPLLSNQKRQWVWSVAVNTGSAADTWLRRQNGTGTDRAPYIIPVDCNLNIVTITNDANNIASEWNFRIFVNGSELAASYLQATGAIATVYDNLSVAFTKGDRVTLRGTKTRNSINIVRPGGSLYFTET